MESNYTVADLAKKMHMTERTIRNYLKTGALKGTRIGGQWRFSDKDLQDFFENSEVRKRVMTNASTYAKEYIDHKYTVNGNVTVCSIVDYKYPNQELLDKLECEIAKVAKEYKGNVRLTALSEDGCGRCTIVGTIECVKRILEILSILERKE